MLRSAQHHNFDVSWLPSLTGGELHRFRYPSVVDKRRSRAAAENSLTGFGRRAWGRRVSASSFCPLISAGWKDLGIATGGGGEVVVTPSVDGLAFAVPRS
jgi:hypothetical protein